MLSQPPPMLMHLSQNQKERNPPNKIIGKQGINKLKWHESLRIIEKETNRAEYLTQKADRNNRPMPNRVVRCPPIAESVHANHHAHALPDHRMVQRFHTHQFKKMIGKEDSPCAPDDVVNGGEL